MLVAVIPLYACLECGEFQSLSLSLSLRYSLERKERQTNNCVIFRSFMVSALGGSSYLSKRRSDSSITDSFRLPIAAVAAIVATSPISGIERKMGTVTPSNSNKGNGSSGSSNSTALASNASSPAFRLMLLIAMVVQNSAVVLVGRYTRSTGAGSDMFIVSHFIFVTEVAKVRRRSYCLSNGVLATACVVYSLFFSLPLALVISLANRLLRVRATRHRSSTSFHQVEHH
jgi:hypothetical protein